MKSLVTGAAGFLGSHLCAALRDRGDTVVGLDDLSGGYRENLPNGIGFVEASILDSDTLNVLFERERFGFVYHLAAYAAEGLSSYIKRFNYMNNVVGSVNLINAAVNTNVSCFIFTSSIAVYGANQSPMREAMVPQPTDSYGIAKYTIEQELQISKHFFDLDYIILRPHNIYGEHQNLADPYRNVVGIFFNHLLQNKPLPIFGDGSQQRAFTYVGDIIGGIAKAPLIPEARNSLFNIGADTPHTINDLARACCESMNQPFQVVYLPAREEVKIAYADHTLARQVLGIEPKTSLQDGLQRVATWVKARGSMPGKPFKNVEIIKNLPPSWRAQIEDSKRADGSSPATLSQEKSYDVQNKET